MPDSSVSWELVANHLLAGKHIAASTGALAIYDYFLTLDDEIKYVWKERKTWPSVLFILNRYMLLAYAIAIETSVSGSLFRLSRCKSDIYTKTVIILFLFFSSDVFIFLRVFAVSGRNKFVGLFLPSLICAKVVASFLAVAQLRVNFQPLPGLPLDEFKQCTAPSPFYLQIVPHAISAVFNFSAFFLILWFAYSSAGGLQFSVLLKTIVADATMYFVMATCVQTVVLLFLVLGDPSINETPIDINAAVTPVLINRLVLSLKKAADVNNNSHGGWNVRHFADRVAPEAAFPHPRMGTSHHDIPLNSLTRHGGSTQSCA